MGYSPNSVYFLVKTGVVSGKKRARRNHNPDLSSMGRLGKPLFLEGSAL
jgi:hypothetical protein